MLALYYFMTYVGIVEQKKQLTTHTFSRLVHETQDQRHINQSNIKEVLRKPFLRDISYQMMLMAPSGQTYIYDYYRDDYDGIKSIALPQFIKLHGGNQFKVDAKRLSGWIELDNGYQLYVNLYHPPIQIYWTSYRYWLPLLVTLVLFMMSLSVVLTRRYEWEQLISYTESLSLYSKDAYSPPPFKEKRVAKEFLRLGHALSRINYQLHKNYRRTQLLSHRLERLIDHAPLPMAMIKRHGQISFVNPRFEQVFATTFQGEDHYTLTDFVNGVDKITHQTLTKLAAQRVSRTLLVNGLADNQVYQLHIMPWFGEHGQIHGFTAILNSVTTFTEQIKETNSQLQLQQARLADFDQMWSVLGHELRTPLSGMIGMLDLLESDNFNDTQKETLATLEDTSHAMLSMLNGMLDMAKLDAGKLKVEVAVVDLLALCQQICELMAGNARRKGIELHYFFDPQCPRYLTTDPGRLRQILMNLIGNAIKFTQSGYVALTIEPISNNDDRYIPPHLANKSTAPDTYSDSSYLNHSYQDKSSSTDELNDTFNQSSTHNHNGLNHEDKWVCFSVRDTGIGIEEEEQSKLFSYFNQANDAISRQFGGTGLGLAISNNFAQLLGGFIHLESTLNVGSTFSVCLPQHAPSYQPVYAYNTDLTSTCLVAFLNQDISAQYLTQLCDHLSLPAVIRTGADASTIQNLNHQITTAKQNGLTPLILMDYEWYRHANTALFEALIDYPKMPKVLLSIMPERGIASQILEQFDGYLSKPLDVSHLISEISRLTQGDWRKPQQPSVVPKGQAPANQFLHTLTPNTKGKWRRSADNDKPTWWRSASQAQASQDLTIVNHHALASLQWRYLPDCERLTHKKLSRFSPCISAACFINVDPNQVHENNQNPLILVAEDNPINQKVACKILEKLGYPSIVAENGQEAIEMLAQYRPKIGLVLMDCRMPILDGLTATQLIRANQDDIPIIALTANDSDDDRNACLQAGMDSFLSKPLNKVKLIHALNQFLSQ